MWATKDIIHNQGSIVMKKKIKIILIVLTLLGMAYAKKKIDTKNSNRIEMLDNLDDGTVKAKH